MKAQQKLEHYRGHYLLVAPIALLLAVAACFTVMNATAVVVLDQEYVPRPTLVTQARTNDLSGQSFTVGRTGVLTRVEIWVLQETGVTNGMTVFLYRLNGNNAQFPPLAEVAIANNAIPVGNHPANSNMLRIDLSIFNIRVGTGDVLGILVQSPISAGPKINWFGGCNGNDTAQCGSPGTSDGYARGSQLQTTALPPVSTSTIIDLGFRTFVDGFGGPVITNQPPVITNQPQNLTVSARVTANFTVGATGTEPLSYIWYFNGAVLPDRTASTLSITNAQSTNAGNYWVVVTNVAGSATSEVATLTVKVPPTIVSSPQSQIAIVGTNVTLDVVATGPGPLAYQWKLNSVPISGATNTQLTLTNVQPSQGGVYSVVVTNADGSVGSGPAIITVRCVLTVNVSGMGTVTRQPASATYSPTTRVTLTATPAPDSTFNRWSGDATGTNNPIVLLMSTNRAVTAHFTGFPIILSSSGAGSVSKEPDKPFYTLGEQVVLTATPDRWFGFAGWHDGMTDNPRRITVLETNIYTAFFSATTALETLSFNNVTRTAPIGMPAIFVDGEFITNSFVARLSQAEISIRTTFPNGSIFFTLDSSEPFFGSALYSGPFSLRRSALIRAIAYDANFSSYWEADAVRVEIQPVYTVTASTAGGGAISTTPATPFHRSNDLVNLSATPDDGWQFLQWLGDVSGTNPIATIRIIRDSCVQAMFGTSLDVTQVGSGVIGIDPLASVYPFGTVVRLSALPATGSFFAAWGNAASSTNNPLLFPITNANPTVSCAFGSLPAGQSALSVTINGRGRVLPSPRPNRVNSTQTITLTAVPDPDQAFLGWSGDATSTHTNLTLSMNQSRVITASFTSRSRLLLGPCLGGWSAEGFRFTLSGDIGRHYSVETSPTAEGWTPLVTITNHFGIAQFLNPATNSPQRFYRARLLP